MMVMVFFGTVGSSLSDQDLSEAWKAAQRLEERERSGCGVAADGEHFTNFLEPGPSRPWRDDPHGRRTLWLPARSDTIRSYR